MKKAFAFISFLVSLTLPLIGFASGDAAAGKNKYATCAGCHGPDGKSSNPTYPKLAGQHEAYLVYALNAYKNNERSGNLVAQMAPFAMTLSDQDIKDLAAYLASQ